MQKILEEHGRIWVALGCLDEIDHATPFLVVKGAKELETLLEICKRSKSPVTIELDFSEDTNGEADD